MADLPAGFGGPDEQGGADNTGGQHQCGDFVLIRWREPHNQQSGGGESQRDVNKTAAISAREA